MIEECQLLIVVQTMTNALFDFCLMCTQNSQSMEQTMSGLLTSIRRAVLTVTSLLPPYVLH